MRKAVFVIVMTFIGLVQIGCKKNDVLNKNTVPNTKKTFEESSSFSVDFCSLTSSEPELDFGLDRSPDSNFYVFTQSEVNAGLANFHTNFRYSDSGIVQNLDSSKQSLSIDELLQLYSVLESDSSMHYDSDSDYSALRMQFGMEAKRIILIYEPVVLKPSLVPKECSVVNSGKYFRVDSSNNFVVVSSGSFSSLVSNFKNTSSKIHITHPFNPSIYNFINADDASGDIRSNIISFQQIVKMYCDNAQGASLSDRINFTIVANQNLELTSNFRMHVVPNYALGLSSPSSGTYKNYAADFVQMCPVNCNIVSVNFYD